MRVVVMLMALACIAAADGWKTVERKDWVADWDRYIQKATTMADGKVLKFRGPARNARREILMRIDYDAQVAAGMRKPTGALSVVPALTATVSPLKLGPLDVIELAVDDALVRALEFTGDAVLFFWTVSQPGVNGSPSSRLYIQGRRSGHVVVRVTLEGGATRLIHLDVP